jgi:dTDP-L-rhamnose 4-epimerase
MSKALVTGGAGLIGSHLADLLLQSGYDVRVIDNLEPVTHPGGRPPWISSDIEFLEGDMRNQEDVESAVRGVDVVFHQAAYGGFAPELAKMTDSNAMGTTRLFEAIRSSGSRVTKVVTASSQAVYGEGKYVCEKCGPFYPSERSLDQLDQGKWEQSCPECGEESRAAAIEEEAPLRFRGIYALTKMFEERLTISLGQEWQLPTVALRYSLTYGPRQSVSNPYTGICSIFSTRLLNGLPPILYEDGQQSRDFVFVKDVARANMMVMESESANYGIFNVGTGVSTTVATFAALLARSYGLEIEPKIEGEYRPADFRHIVADTEKLTSLGWAPETPLSEGISQYGEWILSLGRPPERFSGAEQELREIGVIRSPRVHP